MEMRRLPAVPPLVSRDPGSLETRQRVSRGGALDSGARASLQASSRSTSGCRDPSGPMVSRAAQGGDASVPGERRARGGGQEDVEGHGAAASGRWPGPRRPGARGRRRGYAAQELEGAVLTASAGSEFGSRPGVGPLTRDRTCKFRRRIVEFGSWKDLGHNPSLY